MDQEMRVTVRGPMLLDMNHGSMVTDMRRQCTVSAGPEPGNAAIWRAFFRLYTLAGPEAAVSATLTGRLVWDEQALHWNAEWRLEGKGELQQWRSSAVTYDEAFRQGLGGAAQIMSSKQ